MSRYGVSDSTSSAGSSPGQFGDERRPTARRDRRARRTARRARLLEDLEHRHGLAAARRLARGDDDLRLARAAGAARRPARRSPEKIGTWIAPMCAQACEAIAASRRHRQEERDAVAGLDAEPDERLREPRDLARELGEGERGPPCRPRPARPRRASPGRPLAQRCTQLRAIDDLPPGNQVVHSGPRESSTTASHGSENSSPMSSITSGQNHAGSFGRPARRARGSQPCPRAARAASRWRAHDLRRRAPDDLTHERVASTAAP